MIEFNCPKCGIRLSAPASAAGQTVSCPDCQNVTVAPDQAYGTPPANAVLHAQQGIPQPPSVGTAYRPYPVANKSPILALILSLVIVGLGQFYNGDIKKGFAMLGIAIVGGIFSAGLLWFGAAIWSAIDAYQVAAGTGKPWA